MEIYVDDFLIKNKMDHQLIELEEAFAILQNYNMRIKATKSMFGVGSGNSLTSWNQKGGSRLIKKIRIIIEMTL